MRQVGRGIVLLLLAAGCGRHRSTRPEDVAVSEATGDSAAASAAGPDEAAAAAPRESAPRTETEMSNVDLRIAEGVTLHVRRLAGEAVSARRGSPVQLDDKSSYEIHVRSAQAAIGYDDLSRILNDYTLAYDGAPVEDVEISREEDAGEEDQIQLKGRLRKALGVAFEIEGRPEATSDGQIRIRTTSIHALHVKVGGLMDALGLEPGDLLGDAEERGLAMDGDDLVLDASRALPPPRISGRVTAVSVEATGLTLTLGAKPPGTPEAAGRKRSGSSHSASSNYLWFRGGTIRIGKMTQRDADLRIVDDDPGDPLDFYADRMTSQLVAGYAKLGASGGLTMFVPDYGDMNRSRGAGPRGPSGAKP